MNGEMQEFLESSSVIDWQNEAILRLAQRLQFQSPDELSLARSTFEWVRDNIQHCLDFNRSEVTCRASDVLAVGTGFCYAKSHLAAALLRANGLPTGFCYQRLSLDGAGPPFSLHGLNAVYLTSYGWYRFDARGNSESVHADFCPPTEQLAFSISIPGEADLPEIWHEPLSVVVNKLSTDKTVKDLSQDLPDVQIVFPNTILR